MGKGLYRLADQLNNIIDVLRWYGKGLYRLANQLNNFIDFIGYTWDGLFGWKVIRITQKTSCLDFYIHHVESNRFRNWELFVYNWVPHVEWLSLHGMLVVMKFVHLNWSLHKNNAVIKSIYNIQMFFGPAQKTEVSVSDKTEWSQKTTK